MKILHLSDLHFGYDENQTMEAQRSNLLNSLIWTVPQPVDKVKQPYLNNNH